MNDDLTTLYISDDKSELLERKEFDPITTIPQSNLVISETYTDYNPSPEDSSKLYRSKQVRIESSVITIR